MQDVLLTLLPYVVLLLATFAASHALLYKRDTRAVIAWVGLIMLVPLAGAILYWMLGVNRVRRRAVALRPRGTPPERGRPEACADPPEALAPLARVGDQVGPFPLVSGNSVEPLENGDEAFPPMLQAIATATLSIAD